MVRFRLWLLPSRKGIIALAEDALERFVKAVQKHYEAPDAPALLLSSFGQRHKALLLELKEAHGSLASAVRAAGENRLKFIDTTRGQEAIAPSGIAGPIQLRLEEDSASQRQAASFFDSLPHSIQLAFCVRTDPGEHIAIDTVRPFKFAKITAPDLIRQTQRIVPDKYRRPGLSLKSASVQDREALWRQFSAWADETGIDPASFRHGQGTTALSRLLAAQPPELISQMIIPADIAQILIKHP